MCMACQEMELYYAYLDAVEEEKRKAQPWQCEVTLISDGDETIATPTPVNSPAAKAPAAKTAKPLAGFVCDDPE